MNTWYALLKLGNSYDFELKIRLRFDQHIDQFSLEIPLNL